MAKKKTTFDNIVEESFNEGYQSEPEVETPVIEPDEVQEQTDNNIIEETLSENEQELRKILAGDEVVLKEIWDREDRSTYYLTDLHRACIDIMSHEEGITKGAIVKTALENFFSDDVKEKAKDRVVTLAVKKLEREISKENK